MDYLRLKWGTVKAFDFSNSPEALEFYRQYNALGESISVMLQEDTPEQKELICKMIDACNGEVHIHWGNQDCTLNREIAKNYVMEYSKPQAVNPVKPAFKDWLLRQRSRFKI